MSTILIFSALVGLAFGLTVVAAWRRWRDFCRESDYRVSERLHG